ILKHEIEQMELDRNNINEEEYNKLLFKYSCADSQQLALKVYMNSFYGETGNQLSSFFLRELAAAVTSAGQYNIKLVANYVQQKGFRIVYGDTDSLYLILPDEIFSELDQQYQQGLISKHDYWSLMVTKTIEVMTILKNEVNEFLISNNGTEYLKMAYEEVLFPCLFTGKKKYFGIPHYSKPNFKPKKLFIRGIDIIKRGQSQFSKDVVNQIMWESMDINNTRDMYQIINDTINSYVSNGVSRDNISKFVLTATYKPLAKNISVQSFVSRMKQKNINVDPGERFEYVVIEINQKKSKKADRMELLETFRNNSNMRIDVVYYLNSLVSVLARLINGDFQSPDDKQSQLDAQKYIEDQIKYYMNSKQNLNSFLNIDNKKKRKPPRSKYTMLQPERCNQTLDNFISKKRKMV